MRVAIRKEGNFINAYAAELGTMEGAHLIGSIARACVEEDPEVFEAFKRCVTLALAAILEGVAGIEVVDFVIEPAPEHERAGEG